MEGFKIALRILSEVNLAIIYSIERARCNHWSAKFYGIISSSFIAGGLNKDLRADFFRLNLKFAVGRCCLENLDM